MTVTNFVRMILRENKAARSSDRELFVDFMQRSGMELTGWQIERLKNMPSLETVRRIRQKIQEQGDYLADSSVRRERSHKAMVMQQNIPKDKPEHIEKRLSQRVLPWGNG